MTTMGQRQCTPTMPAMTAMAETATAMATVMAMAMAMAMMLLLLPMAMMPMTMTAAIQGRQLDNSNLTTTMGQQGCTSMMRAMMAMVETATATVTAMAMATAMATVTAMMPPPPPMATMSMKTMAAIQGLQLGDGNWMTTMGRRQCDDNGRSATCRTLASAAPTIQGNNQLMWTVWGQGDKREGQFGGIKPQKRVMVELIE